uniref:Uncharacterized protein n=1 Tax=Biomphalaria glabrata TaxID=6526 RepID=A0A2C9L8P5_BIOGL
MADVSFYLVLSHHNPLPADGVVPVSHLLSSIPYSWHRYERHDTPYQTYMQMAKSILCWCVCSRDNSYNLLLFLDYLSLYLHNMVGNSLLFYHLSTSAFTFLDSFSERSRKCDHVNS